MASGKSKPKGTWRDWDPELLPNCYKKDSGATYTSVYGRMSWDNVSPTITTQFFNLGSGRFGHPEQNRALSLREGAIIQTFPKTYDFGEMSLSTLGRHIGNAVPPKLGEVIGDVIQCHIYDYSTTGR
jgi:DNA (cytosine-5)-methyltransferase 1